MATLNQYKDAQSRLYGSVFSLEPSALITMFEIDLSDILFEMGLIAEIKDTNKHQRVFLFHGEQKVGANSITWQGQRYEALPVQATGFESNSTGTLPKPKLDFISSEETKDYFNLMKIQMSELGDLVGAKVTRIRTLAKFLDAENFSDSNPDMPKPKGFIPDQNAEFPRDVYFIERKLIENKSIMSFEMTSILDVENIRLPLRVMYSNRCTFTYRGEGCCYEFKDRRTSEHTGCTYMPNNAKPIAEITDEDISQIEGVKGNPLSDQGIYSSTTSYSVGNYTHVEKDNIKYYYVCKKSSLGNPPTDSDYWAADKCSKTIKGCRLRWESYVNLGNLPFGGFPALGRIK